MPHSYGKPKIVPGHTFTVGFLNANAEETGLDLVQTTAAAETKALKGKFIAYNANQSITTQVSQFNDLLAQHVNAIIIYPNDPTSFGPELAAAKAAGVPVIAESTPGQVTSPPLTGYTTNVTQGFDQAAYYNAKAAALTSPKSSFVLEGFAAPVPALEYLMARTKYWAQKFGLKFLGEVDTQTDTPSSAQAAMSSILAKYPKVRNIFVWNDTSAETSASVARSNGKHINITGVNGDSVAIKMVESGEMLATFENNWRAQGQQLAVAAYDQLTHQHLPLAPTTVVVGTPIVKSNASRVRPD